MQTQKDHVDAYADQIGRLDSALLLGDAVPTDRPAHRAMLGLVGGSLLAVLIGIVFGVYGLIHPGGNNAWEQAGAVLVEKETGARYVYAGGELHPVLNYASALLLAGEGAHTERITAASLADLPRGDTLGISGAPDTVPAAGDLSTSGWLLCLPSAGSAAGSSGANGQVQATSGLDFAPTYSTSPVTTDSIALVRSTQGTEYVVSNGTRYAVADDLVPVVLGMQDEPVVTAPGTWLDQLPVGPELAPLSVDGAGSPGPTVGGVPHNVGDVLSYTAENGRSQRFVVLADGIAALSEFDVAMLDAAGTPVTPVDSAALAQATRSATSLSDRVPDLLRATPVDSGRALCLSQDTNAQDASVVDTTVVTAPADEAVTSGVHVAAGGGLLVAGVPLPTDGSDPAQYLVTDTGRRYRISGDDAMTALGLSNATPRAVPASVLETIPAGPDLSRSAAGASDEGK